MACDKRSAFAQERASDEAIPSLRSLLLFRFWRRSVRDLLLGRLGFLRQSQLTKPIHVLADSDRGSLRVFHRPGAFLFSKAQPVFSGGLRRRWIRITGH